MEKQKFEKFGSFEEIRHATSARITDRVVARPVCATRRNEVVKVNVWANAAGRSAAETRKWVVRKSCETRTKIGRGDAPGRAR